MEKVAVINSVYEYSSTGMLTKQLYEYGTKKGYEVFVFYGRGKTVSDSHIIRIFQVNFGKKTKVLIITYNLNRSFLCKYTFFIL